MEMQGRRKEGIASASPNIRRQEWQRGFGARPREAVAIVWSSRLSIYSVCSSLQGSGAKIIFDHTGFPKGAGEHLAAGWKAHYREPLEKFLG
jgi:hypothetical protein